ncbi:MAG: PAS domain-containing sensor histidine kinase [Gammaproteobacteria bacterium]|nr:PAS domain-containing sensor histidine kinase [Gammaproteobacteria bacterium]
MSRPQSLDSAAGESPNDTQRRLGTVAGAGASRSGPGAARGADAPGVAEERLRVLLDGIPNPFFYMKADMTVDFSNEEFAAMGGRTASEVAGKDVRAVLGDEYERHAEYLARALAGEEVAYEATVPSLGGAPPRYLRITNRPIRGRDGAVQGVLSEASDVTQLKRLEAQTKASEAKFRMLAEGVPNHMLYLDRDLRIEFANDVFLQAAGWTAETARGRHISEVLGAERYEKRIPYYQRALAGEVVTYESTGAAGSESGFFRFSYRPSYDAAGDIHGIFSVAVDISARRKVELELEAKQAELLRSNKDLEQFAYVASHDLKAPLRAIDLLVQWIAEELEGHQIGDVQENLALLGQRTQRLGRLLDDLLAYSRAGRKIGQHRSTDCQALVRDVIQLMSPPDGFSVGIDGVLPTFETYPTPLEQVFRNLIGNAVKHHPGPQGTVTVSCEEQAEHYVFAVADDGPGIPDEYAERVFEMFQTLKPRDQVEGSGMGLAIVNRIVAWQGGRVWFESPERGTGTIFRFEWRKQAPTHAATEER